VNDKLPMTKREFQSADDTGHNNSDSPSFTSILEARMSRRSVLKGSLGLLTTSMLSFGIAGCNDGGSDGGSDDDNETPPLTLSFNPIAKSLADMVVVPAGYTATPLYRLGDPINTSTPAYLNDGTDTAASFQYRCGDHNDGMSYFGLNSAGNGWDAANAERGIICMNHENITRIFLHTPAEVAAYNVSARVAAEVDKEVHAHGVSVIEIQKKSGAFALNTASSFNRRITAATPCDIHGPARGHAQMVTAYSPNGTQTRGTLNNCANGDTPWGTYLTCEENWAGYFKSGVATHTAQEQVAMQRYGITSSNGSYGWANATPAGDLYDRWNASVTGASANLDYRNITNTFGWVVEVDPFNPTAAPRKRTALGRMGHEGCNCAKVTAGKPLVFYMGDDAQNEYIYKYVSAANWDPADASKGLAAGDKYLDNGSFYVARFNADGTGNWLKLDIAQAAIAGYATYSFTDQADVLINCRLAADALGATKMDRPEWAGINPVNGDVYVTLTNNASRGSAGKGLDAANPRYYQDSKGGNSPNKGNVNGHIVRWRENGSDPTATSFVWDVYLFGAQAKADAANVNYDEAFYQAHINLSDLTDDNDFSSPDGLWFSRKTPGLMWLQTDDGAYTDMTNCMLLAALPGTVSDGGAVTVTSKVVPANGDADQNVTTYVGKAPGDKLKRFLVGPKGCELTGITETPDGKALFVNIQHPGENTTAADIGTPANYQSHYPDGGTARPRSTTIVITRNDGGPVGV